MKPEDEIHEIDGIIELNEPPPFWWQTLFYLTIAWGALYGAYYLFGNGKTLREELTENLLKIEMKQVQQQVSPEEEQKSLLAILSAPERLAEGHRIFSKNCISCHGANAAGGIGPNLTDSVWIHGDGSPVEILKVVRVGVAEKGMPPWGSLLPVEETLLVSAYVSTLHVKNSK